VECSFIKFKFKIEIYLKKIMEISFLFRSPTHQRGYGKIRLRYYSDDHNGIDDEIRPYVMSALRSDSPISIAILGISTEFSSDQERYTELFDLYIDCSDRLSHHYYYIYLGKSRYLYREEDYMEDLI